MPPADDSLLSASTSSSNISPSRSQSHSLSHSPSPGPSQTRTTSSRSRSPSQSAPAIDPASSSPPSEASAEAPSTLDGSDAHLTDAEFATKMDEEVLRLGEVSEWEAKLERREDWLGEVRARAKEVREMVAARGVKVEDGEETESGLGGREKAEAAFLRQSHRYLTKQLKSLDSDDWRFASSEDRDVNTPWNQDRLFVPATTLDMAAGKRGWGNERDDMGDATMEVVGEEDEVWGRGGR